MIANMKGVLKFSENILQEYEINAGMHICVRLEGQGLVQKLEEQSPESKRELQTSWQWQNTDLLQEEEEWWVSGF